MKNSLILILLFPYLVFAQNWDHIIQDIDTTSTIRLEGEKWNNTLIKNCVVHDTKSGKDGILLKNVSNVRVENCLVYNINGQGGIRLSMSDGGTKNVEIINNTVYNIQGNGIDTPQRSQNTPPANQENLKIIGNTIYNTGLRSTTGHDHAIYCQAADVLIKNNLIYGVRDGNGISVRSSGIVSGNRISGKSKANKSAIRYYSDHYTGNSKTLTIENNMINNDSTDSHTFELVDFAKLYKNDSGNDNHIVKNFNIRFNTIISYKEKKYAIRVSNDFKKTGYSVKVEGNLLVNTTGSGKHIQIPENGIQLYNLKTKDLSNFVSNEFPYDFHIKKNNPAINFVGQKSSNFPIKDIDGDPRNTNALDAGADQYISGSSSSPLRILKKNSHLQIFPNPVNSQNVNIISEDYISKVEIYNQTGKKIYCQEFNPTSKKRRIQLTNKSTGLYFIIVNKKYTSTLSYR